jgi:uncharacterized protein (DUF433 family)
MKGNVSESFIFLICILCFKRDFSAKNFIKESYTMQTHDRITIDPAICHGKPCIRGLRYPVENVLEWLAGGMTIDDILGDYEDLERDDILATLAYAARLAHIKSTKVLAA